MMTRLRHVWEVLTTGYWFVPTGMMLGAAGAAFLLVYIDKNRIGGQVDWLYAGGPQGAMTLLSTVAGSVITVAGVVFSITMAALTQASIQFGPRLLRNFMRDTGNQVVLGTFVATFIYCLLVLRTIHGDVGAERAFVPQASVTVAVILAAASIAVLIYFIHHVSVSLQAPSVVAAVLADLELAIARLPEDQGGSATTIGATEVLPASFNATARSIRATKGGYVQVVDHEGLVRLAERSNLIIRAAYRPGDYVTEGTPLVHAWPAERCDNEGFAARVNSAFVCGRNATTEQDVEQAVRQIVEVAVRALSPGVNDPFTAINCIDALGSAVCWVARMGLPGHTMYDKRGQMRLVTPVTTFAGIVDSAFNQIRQYGRGSVPVTLRLLETIRTCAGEIVDEAQRACLLHHAKMVYEDAQGAIRQPRDRDDLRQRWEAALHARRDEAKR